MMDVIEPDVLHVGDYVKIIESENSIFGSGCKIVKCSKEEATAQIFNPNTDEFKIITVVELEDCKQCGTKHWRAAKCNMNVQVME